MEAGGPEATGAESPNAESTNAESAGTPIGDPTTQHAGDQAVIAHLEADGVIDRNTIANLEIALGSARRIGAAVGIIMAMQNLTEEQASQVLRQASQNRNRKLRNVANAVLLTGTLE